MKNTKDSWEEQGAGSRGTILEGEGMEDLQSELTYEQRLEWGEGRAMWLPERCDPCRGNASWSLWWKGTFYVPGMQGGQ